MKKHQSANGNALFLVLIAVALFAALSYAITSSGRGSGTSADKEKKFIETAQWLQSVSQIRSAVQRMGISGVAAADIEFCANPADDLCVFSNSVNELCTTGENCVFAPEGGSVIPPNLPYNPAMTLTLVEFDEGISVSGFATTEPEALMYLSAGITEADCIEINKILTITGAIAQETTADTVIGDGSAVSGLFDFCYDADPTGATDYRSVHVLFAQ